MFHAFFECRAIDAEHFCGAQLIAGGARESGAHGGEFAALEQALVGFPGMGEKHAVGLGRKQRVKIALGWGSRAEG